MRPDGEWSSSLLRAFLFDFDGTLVDAFDSIVSAVNDTLVEFGLPQRGRQEVISKVGHGALYLLGAFVPERGLEEALSWYKRRYLETFREGTRLIPGVAETLAALKEASFLTGVVTNKPAVFTKEALDFLGIDSLLDIVSCGDEHGALKPDPGMLLGSLAALGVPPEEAAYVGDLPVDMTTALAAGVYPIGVLTGMGTRAELAEAGAKLVLTGVGELTTTLARSL